MAGNRWDRIENETSKAFAAFLVYRDLPSIDRSVAALRSWLPSIKG